MAHPLIRRLGDRLSSLIRKPAPPAPINLEPDVGKDNKSWAAGDMAECILGGHWLNMTSVGLFPARGPVQGEVRVVRAITIDTHPQRGEVLFLAFARYPGHYEAACFRKLQPTADNAGAADGEFLRDFTDRLKPARIVERVPASREDA